MHMCHLTTTPQGSDDSWQQFWTTQLNRTWCSWVRFEHRPFQLYTPFVLHINRDSQQDFILAVLLVFHTVWPCHYLFGRLDLSPNFDFLANVLNVASIFPQNVLNSWSYIFSEVHVSSEKYIPSMMLQPLNLQLGSSSWSWKLPLFSLPDKIQKLRLRLQSQSRFYILCKGFRQEFNQCMWTFEFE